jgi:hypothetical protein
VSFSVSQLSHVCHSVCRVTAILFTKTSLTSPSANWELLSWPRFRHRCHTLRKKNINLGYIFWTIGWLVGCLQFYVPLKNFSLIWRRHHCWWRAAKFRPMLGAQGLWAGRDLYRATPTVTRDLGFSGHIRRTAPFSRLLRHTRGCVGSILTRILTGFEP